MQTANKRPDNGPSVMSDLETLSKLNADYLASDQNSDVERYEQFLAPEFTASLPDFKLYDRESFLEMIAKPRPFTNLQCHDLQITLLGDVALVHAAMTLKNLKGELRRGRYTEGRVRPILTTPLDGLTVESMKLAHERIEKQRTVGKIVITV
jgi:ketosteroid isomerase-like protein